MTEHSGAYGCKCDMCRARRAKYARERRRLLREVGPQITSAEKSSRHIQMLVDQGMSVTAIAECSGLSRATVTRILNHGTSVKVTATTESTLLSVKFRPVGLRPMSKIDATGTRRRIQALAFSGWSLKQMADRLGVEHSHFARSVNPRQRFVTRQRAEAVRRLYAELWDQSPPEDVHQQYAVARRMRAWARREGFAPPMAWDDDTIDDPDAEPDLGTKVRGGGVRVEEVRFLKSFGQSNQQIAHRFGVSPDFIRDKLRGAA